MNATRFSQKGAGTLLVTVLLLLSASVVVLYLNRSLIFEQKTSANQLRSTTAMEVAEAGLEWAVGMLNNPEIINNTCTLGSGTNVSFRNKYLQFATGLLPTVTAASPGCRISNGALTCSCPDAGTATLSNATTPNFTVSFTAVPLAEDASGESVRITSVGCTASTAACTAASAAQADATATVSMVTKLRPMVRAGPAAALTCGTTCEVNGSYDIINNSVATNGILVNAGGDITRGNGTTMVTIPGVPVENAMVGQDSSLSALSGSDANCNNSAVFNAYFGTTIAAYAAAPTTKTITCSAANTCGDLSIQAYAQGWRAFYFPSGVDYNNSSGFTTLGTTSDPVTIVTPQNFNINGNITINGLVFSNSSNVNDLGTGTANINGSIIACAAYRNNGSGTLTYSDDILKNLQRNASVAVKVPGSWRDFQ